jgi:hypothetical protein
MRNRSRSWLYLRVCVAALLAGLVLGLGLVAESPATATTPPTTSVLVPAAGAKLSGTTTLDASASNATSVEFWLLGGSYGFTGDMIGKATLTSYGWYSSWYTTTVPNASYALLSEAFNAGGIAFSAASTVTVNNPPPSMPPPAWYTSQQMIFDDQFSGTSLDTDNWTTYLGADGQVWNNLGSLPLPYSAGNSVANGGSGDAISMYSPSQVTVHNGLTLTARRNTNQWSSTYPWISGVVTTEGKLTLPTSGWYVQVKAEMPDQSRGMWPAIWFLCGTSCPDENELDGYEGGFLLGGTNPNDVMHSDYFADQGQQQSAFDVDTDVTAGYNVYGFQFIPGQSITAYFNGTQVWQVNASSGVTIASEPYQIMLELQVAGTPTSGWHTVASFSTPTSSMKVAEVQVYSAP